MKQALAAFLWVFAMLGSTAGHALASDTVSVFVPASSDPWLAGMPDGSFDPSGGGTAPGNSPALVAGLPLQAGEALTFAASGSVSNGGCGLPYCPTYGPEGGPYPYSTNLSLGHDTGDDNGISNLISPINALVGVFLTDAVPALNAAPPTLDFSTSQSRDYAMLSPLLQQTFYIGDGLSSGGVPQQIVVPTGATRLYLGTMDGCCWYDNHGSFSVQVTQGAQIPAVPEPSSVVLLALGLCAWLLRSLYLRIGRARQRSGFLRLDRPADGRLAMPDFVHSAHRPASID